MPIEITRTFLAFRPVGYFDSYDSWDLDRNTVTQPAMLLIYSVAYTIKQIINNNYLLG